MYNRTKTKSLGVITMKTCWDGLILEYKGIKLELYEPPVLDVIHKTFYHCTAKGDDGKLYDLSISLDETTVYDIAEI